MMTDAKHTPSNQNRYDKGRQAVTKMEHAPRAIRAAMLIFFPHSSGVIEFDKECVKAIADIINRETGLPDLLEALEDISQLSRFDVGDSIKAMRSRLLTIQQTAIAAIAKARRE